MNFHRNKKSHGTGNDGGTVAVAAHDGGGMVRHTEGHNPADDGGGSSGGHKPADERWQERERKVICSD